MKKDPSRMLPSDGVGLVLHKHEPVAGLDDTAPSAPDPRVLEAFACPYPEASSSDPIKCITGLLRYCFHVRRLGLHKRVTRLPKSCVDAMQGPHKELLETLHDTQHPSLAFEAYVHGLREQLVPLLEERDAPVDPRTHSLLIDLEGESWW